MKGDANAFSTVLTVEVNFKVRFAFRGATSYREDMLTVATGQLWNIFGTVLEVINRIERCPTATQISAAQTSSEGTDSSRPRAYHPYSLRNSKRLTLAMDSQNALYQQDEYIMKKTHR